MSYPPGTGNGLKDVSLSIAGTRRRLCTASSCIPCPTCTVFLTDHRGLKLATFVGSTMPSSAHRSPVLVSGWFMEATARRNLEGAIL